jgi:penicillin-binding protein-related factor A (putative recombinase)
MLENKFNTIFKNSLIDSGFLAFKIKDVGHGHTTQNPVDGFALKKGMFLMWEGKRLKGIKAFNFNSFEPQQLPILQRVHELGYTGIVPVYFYIPRKSFVLIFNVSLLTELIKKDKTSILKKEIEKLADKFAIPLKKERFDLTKMTGLIVSNKVWEYTIGG